MNANFYQPMHNTQPARPVKKSSGATVVASLITAGLSLLLTIAWFLPVVSYRGHAFTYLDALSQLSGSNASAAASGFWFLAIYCAVAILWAAIPKRWAAITGLVYSLLPMFFGIYQVMDWKSNGLSLAFGGTLLLLLPILVFAATLVKLVLAQKDKKQIRATSNGTYGAPYNPFGYEPQASQQPVRASQTATRFCAYCGTKLTQETEFCPNCGQRADDM